MKRVQCVRGAGALLLAGLLACGVIYADDAPPRERQPIDLTGKILIPGMKLTDLAGVKDLEGKPIRLGAAGKQVIVFSAPECVVCLDLLASIETAARTHDTEGRLQRIYVIAGSAEAAAAQVKSIDAHGMARNIPGKMRQARAAGHFKAGWNLPDEPAVSNAPPPDSGATDKATPAAGAKTVSPIRPPQAVAEADERVFNHLKIPFRPYALLAENGEIKMLLFWEKNPARIEAMLRFFLFGRPEAVPGTPETR